MLPLPRQPALRYYENTTEEDAMRRALKEIPEHPMSYGERIRDLIERNQIDAARSLVSEAVTKGVREEGLESWQRVLAPAKVLGVGLVPKEPDRSREELWLATHAESYRGRWVALDGDTLLAQAATFTELADEIDRIRPVRNPLAYRFD
jgi:hypothetical protein